MDDVELAQHHPASTAGDASPSSGASAEAQQVFKKKRPSGASSSRGVANLTPEQLARKRANDREAQRAIRERTKNQIDQLNKRIRELESQQPYHELQVVLKQKEAVQAENDDIRRRLTSVLGIIQPILGGQGLDGKTALRRCGTGLMVSQDLAAAAECNPLPQSATDQHGEAMQLVTTDSRNFSHRPASSIPTDHSPSTAHNSITSPDGNSSVSRSWAFPGAQPTSHMRGWPASGVQYEQQRNSTQQDQPELHFTHYDERLGVDFLLDRSAQRPKINGISQSEQESSGAHPSVYSGRPLHAYSTLPRNLEPTCPLDSILIDFLRERRARALEGLPSKLLVGPLYPNFSCLVHPERNIDSHPLSKIFTDILRTFPDICGLPEQVAVVFIMFLVMRWMIEPTQENYERLPDWITPRPSQLFTPHPHWMDYGPWPYLRDRMVQSVPHPSFETFFIPYTVTLSLNWPYEPRDCLVLAPSLAPSLSATGSQISATSPHSNAAHAGSPVAASTPGGASSVGGNDEQWLINPAFESHLRNLSNWSLGDSFRNTFPQLADVITIRDSRR